jgi:hypothetical protein
MTGMTNANMKLVVLSVVLPDQLETPSQQLEPGEFIVSRVIQLSKLNDELKGIVSVSHHLSLMTVCLLRRLHNKGTGRCILLGICH